VNGQQELCAIARLRLSEKTHDASENEKEWNDKKKEVASLEDQTRSAV
jgi:hypothetical protein